jgi:hypothetical protein
MKHVGRNLRGTVALGALCALIVPLASGCNGVDRQQPRLDPRTTAAYWNPAGNFNGPGGPLTRNQPAVNNNNAPNRTYGPLSPANNYGRDTAYANRWTPGMAMPPGGVITTDPCATIDQRLARVGGTYRVVSNCPDKDKTKEEKPTKTPKGDETEETDEGETDETVSRAPAAAMKPAVWEEICLKKEGFKVNRAPGVDRDAIPPAFEKCLEDEGYVLAKDMEGFRNGYRVAIRALDAAAIVRIVKQRANELPDSEKKLKEAIAKAIEDAEKSAEATGKSKWGIFGKAGAAFWESFKAGWNGGGAGGQERDLSVLNNSLATLLVLDQLSHKQDKNHTSLAVVHDLLASTTAQDDYLANPDDEENLTAVLSGDNSKPIFLDVLSKAGKKVSIAEISGATENLTSLSDGDEFVAVAEAFVHSPLPFEIGISGLKAKTPGAPAGRSAGVLALFVDGQLKAHSIDLSGVNAMLDNRLGRVSARTSAVVESGSPHHLVAAMLVKRAKAGKEKEFIREGFYFAGRDGVMQNLPGHIALPYLANSGFDFDRDARKVKMTIPSLTNSIFEALGS